MFAGKPYLTLHVEAEFLPFEVFVNGAPVLSDTSGATANETLPVNQTLRAGSNDITLLTGPWDMEDGRAAYDDHARAKLTLLLQEAGALDKPPQEIASLQFIGREAATKSVTAGSSATGSFDSTRQLAPAPNGDVSVMAPRTTELPGGGMLVERTVSLPLPFIPWEFLSSDSVPTTYNLSEEELRGPYAQLMSAYETIWQGLKNRNLESIMPLFEERSRNNDRAFYFPAGTTQQKLRAAFQQALDDTSMELAPLRLERAWTYDVGPNGKLMRVVHGERSSAIIRFEDKKNPGIRTVFPVTFRKKGDRYIVAL